ncbi:ABC transporter permease subunit [Modestobacter sp. I12A-02628]|uniref:ABC transporter permease n=1 Tax=Goekera deserti TaxID=2497753 RepID=A0A7K3WL18_9ACTN|nr:ABC transporter permease [Goekera deserti]MPQ99340.1 ABC transporter permease subunit [Goekera deserti]NDI50339.1 ABC transporter permease [Goekera deserti]NEL56410.1 ABC transporter permease [Goekera deserti]
MSAPEAPTVTRPSSLRQVGLVARREVSTRITDRTFLVTTVVTLVLIIGLLVFQVLLNSDDDPTRVGVVGSSSTIEPFLTEQATAFGQEVQVSSAADEAELRTQVEDGDVDAGLVLGDRPQLLFDESADDSVVSIVRGAVAAESVQEQLVAAGVRLDSPPAVQVVELQPRQAGSDQLIGVASAGAFLTYFLLILFGQFAAQGVVEEKSSRVVELLLSTMRPWQLLAGKILGLGVLGLLQIVLLAVIGLGGALAAGVLDLPGQAVGTVAQSLMWFILAYALYASLFAAAASLVSRQEDLGSVLTPMTMLLVVGFIIAVQAIGNPGGTLATVTSFVPGVSPLVMPIRAAAGEASVWEVLVAVALMLVAVVLVVRLGGRIYAGALLRTGGKIKYREALTAER